MDLLLYANKQLFRNSTFKIIIDCDLFFVSGSLTRMAENWPKSWTLNGMNVVNLIEEKIAGVCCLPKDNEGNIIRDCAEIAQVLGLNRSIDLFNEKKLLQEITEKIHCVDTCKK